MNKRKLLVVELWGVGDLIIATPFLRAASERYEVTLLAKPYALEMQPRFWPGVKVVPFVAPWTAFRRKYHLWRWPWIRMAQLWRQMSRERFDFGMSARWDPRDHLLLFGWGAKRRYGYPRAGSRFFLNHPVERPAPESDRYEFWRTVAHELGIELPERHELPLPVARPDGPIIVHTGAAREVRVWPLERFRQLITGLRRQGREVIVACDEGQRGWWLAAGETDVRTPHSIAELVQLLDRAGYFLGNDSGPGHLAAYCGVPTFTIFGPQLPEWFAPLHPKAEWIEGAPCPYKPCHDYCCFDVPHCIINVTLEEVEERFMRFLEHCGQKETPSLREQALPR